jgi:hypothetical protein
MAASHRIEAVLALKAANARRTPPKGFGRGAID